MFNNVTFKNITGTLCVMGLFLSPINSNSSTIVNGNNMSNINYYNHYNNKINTSGIDTFNNYYIKKRNTLETEAKELFGIMRDATVEEQEGLNNYIESIAKNTGVNFFNIC